MAILITVINNIKTATITFGAFELLCYNNDVFFTWGICGGLALTETDGFGNALDISALLERETRYVEQGKLPVGCSRIKRPVPTSREDRWREVVKPYNIAKRNVFKDLQVDTYTHE
jgi:hypothetical protein